MTSGEPSRHIHLDLVGGLAGDMFLAGAIDAGLVDIDRLQSVLSEVGLGAITIETETVVRGAIEGTHVEFCGWDESAERDHRHLSTIRQMLSDSPLSQPVKERAIAMFERLGRAEADVHGMELEEVHFHEVGAVDSILDFVAAAWIIESSDATWSVGSIPAGQGVIETAHGTIPVPAPATARVLEGMEIDYRDVDAELVTPTGATIAATIREIGGDKQGTMGATGFGCGTREVDGISNVVRFTVLEPSAASSNNSDHDSAGFQREDVLELVTDIDDQSPELLAHVADAILDAGALDVVTQTVLMKKGRVGQRLAVLCRRDDEERLVQSIFEETTTLGIRRRPVQRWTLQRRHETVRTEFGDVTVKIGHRGDEVLTISPEYDSCARCADEAEVPIRRVYAAASAAASIHDDA